MDISDIIGYPTLFISQHDKLIEKFRYSGVFTNTVTDFWAGVLYNAYLSYIHVHIIYLAIPNYLIHSIRSVM